MANREYVCRKVRLFNMAQKRNYTTKKKGKTEVQPFWNMSDIKNVAEWFEKNNEWDGYLITLLELLLGRRIGDTVDILRIKELLHQRLMV